MLIIQVFVTNSQYYLSDEYQNMMMYYQKYLKKLSYSAKLMLPYFKIIRMFGTRHPVLWCRCFAPKILN